MLSPTPEMADTQVRCVVAHDPLLSRPLIVEGRRMARKLAKSTVERFRRKLLEEESRLRAVIDELERERDEVRLAETSSEHNVDPENADGGSLALELQMDLSIEENAKRLLDKVHRAMRRMDAGNYGICEVSGDAIPLARLEALPYATTTVEYADRV
jgi:RNA polymerase-binding protein DksA